MSTDLHTHTAPRPTRWRTPPERPRLRDDEVHVWLADLAQPPERVESLRRLLAPDELRRAGSFHFERHREAFVVARGLLRTILASYTGGHPRALRLAQTSYGKPFLIQPPDADDIRFNLSHSHRLVLYAFARGREVGVDIEHCRPSVAFTEIAERFFSPREAGVYRGLPAESQPDAFFNCWTRKEAFIKSVGEGLSFPLDEFEVSLGPGEPAALLSVRGDEAEAAGWTLRDLRPAEGYVAALAVEGKGWRLRLWRDQA